MNNKKIYIGLYYFSLILSLIVCIFPNMFLINTYKSNSLISTDFGISGISVILAFINIMLAIIFTIFLIKRKLGNINILFPIIYIIFVVIVFTICTLFNERLIIPYIQYSYYSSFILINYMLLNIYSLLSFNKKD